MSSSQVRRVMIGVATLVVALVVAVWLYNSLLILHTATITQVYWKGEKPYPKDLTSLPLMDQTDVVLCIKEWIPSKGFSQLRDFEAKASKNFLLTAPEQETIRLRLDGSNYNSEYAGFQGFGATIASTDRQKVKPNLTYTLEPLNQSESFKWVVPKTLGVKPVTPLANSGDFRTESAFLHR